MVLFQARVTHLQRVNNTISGNPRFRIELNGMVTHLSEADAAFTHSVTKDWVGQRAVVTLVNNMITDLELVTPREDTP